MRQASIEANDIPVTWRLWTAHGQDVYMWPVHEMSSLETKSRHDTNFVVRDDKVGIMTTLGFQC